MSFSSWCMNKLWYNQTTKSYSVLKRNELSRHEKTWRMLKCLLLYERSQCGMTTHYMIPPMWDSGKGKTRDIKKKKKKNHSVFQGLVGQACMHAKSLQLCLTLCNPMNRSLPGSSVLGILQTRILEWIAVPSSRGYSWPRDGALVSRVSWTGRQVLYH